MGTATAVKNERRVLFFGHETVVDEVGKEGLGAFGADKVAFELLKTAGKAVHVLCVRALAVETAAHVELVEKIGRGGGDHPVAILQPVGCCHTANFLVLNLK